MEIYLSTHQTPSATLQHHVCQQQITHFLSYVVCELCFGISLYPDDEVYLAEEDLRNEYVLNDDGVVYAGLSRRSGPNPARWNFGQVC